MRDLQFYANRCMEMFDSIGVRYGSPITFVENSRAKSRWGQCKKVPNGYQISVNTILLDERNDESGLINTIIHEILHTIDGCMNHGNVWKIYAKKVNDAYGLNIKRVSSADEKGIDSDVLNEKVVKIKHKFICEDCGQVILRQRESDFTKRYSQYTCGCCGGKFNKIF